MTYDKVNYHDVDAVGDGLHFLRNPLDCDEFGLSVLECDPGWTGKSHDHAADEQEEVYLLVEGSASVVVDGETVPMTAGDALRVDPEATRQVRNGDEESLFVVVGAP